MSTPACTPVKLTDDWVREVTLPAPNGSWRLLFRLVWALPAATRMNGPPPIWLALGLSGRDTSADAAWKKPEVSAEMMLDNPLATPTIGPLLNAVCRYASWPDPVCTR